MMRKLLGSFIVSCCVVFPGWAQNYLGVSTGNYSVINKMFINPSTIADSRERVEVNLFSLAIGVDNNLGTLASLGDLGNSNTDVFKKSTSSPFSMIIPAIQMRLPAVVVSLDDDLKQSFGLSMRVRAINQFSHFDPSLYSTITNANYTQSQSYEFSSSNFNWTAHAWSEFGLSYALQAYNKDGHNIKAGVTLKYLGGIDYLALKGRHLDVSYTNGSDTMFAKNSDLEFASNAISSSDAQNSGLRASDVTGSLFGSKAGSGFGMDIGVTYTYTFNGDDGLGPKENNSGAHKIVVSAAVTDVGSIKYKGGDNFFVNVTGNGYLTGKGLSDNLNTWNQFRNYVVTQGFTADTGNKAQKVYLPTAFNVMADYEVANCFYVNALYIGNLANRSRFGNSIYDQVTITPRYERRLFTVGLPITYSMLAHDLKLGLGFRLAGFFLGSDDMMALFSSNQHGFNFYFGGFVPIYKKHKSDDLAK